MRGFPALQQFGLNGGGAQLSCSIAGSDLRTRIKPTFPALADGFLSTVPPGKSQALNFSLKSNLKHYFSC